MKEYSLTLTQKIRLTRDVVQLRFTRPEDFDFLAGQFVQLFVPESGGVTKRSYSIASTPTDPYLEFLIKVLPDGIGTQYLDHLMMTDSINIRGPLGRFTRQKSGGPLCFVATGVGLSPIYGIIAHELQDKRNKQPIHLFFGVRHESDIFWLERLETLARDFPNFSYTLTLSRPSDTWSGTRGRVTDHIGSETKMGHFFLCGSPGMVLDVRTSLLERGIPPTQITVEIF